MDAFYTLAGRDYERLARGFVSHSAWLRRVADGRRGITLLDVAWATHALYALAPAAVCAFDDSVSLEEMLVAPHLGAYLRACRDEARGL